MASTMAGGKDGPLQFLEARLLLASFLAMGVMTFSLVLHSQDLHALGSEPGLDAIRNVARILLALFALPVLVLLAPPLMLGALHDLRRGVLAMDGLVVLAVLAAYGLSLHATWTGTGQVWFETATLVLVLVTFGRRLEAHARSQGRDAASLLSEWLPERAVRLADDDSEHSIEPSQLRVGDRCRVAPGERIPADAVVLSGRSEIVTAHLTGEPGAVSVGPGERVPAGAANGPGELRLSVERPLAAGSLAALRSLLDAPLDITPAMRTTDAWAGRLTLLALVLAALGAAAAPDGPTALRTALSVLLVACPCALGLATPLAYRAVRVALARRGVLAVNAAALERLPLVDHVIFDKTGTLTRPVGRPVVRYEVPGAVDALAGMVAASGHALAACFDTTRAGNSPAPASVQLVPGCGVSALLDGQPARAGSAAWVADAVSHWPPDAPPRDGAGEAGLVAFARGGQLGALVALEQELRAEAPAAVRQLAAAGCSVEVLSGDRGPGLQAVARELRLPVTGGLGPQDKLDRVAAARARGAVVLLVGDGLNDAPALRAADVGVAMGTGTRASRAHAALELVRDDLSALPMLLRAGHVLASTVRGNLLWTCAYNGVALALATAGKLHPLVAAAAMIASSLVVSVRCHRLMNWSDGQAPQP